MKSALIVLSVLLLISCGRSTGDALLIPGISQPVEVIRDPYGINHIYAENQHDLFFTQGYLAAKDRLFQFEIWRRQATGTVAEILGERELKRDIGTRLFKYRGDLEEEFNYYHEDGSEIINAYTDGVNAYIEEVLNSPDSLPVEFKALGILPQKWTPEVVISRHQGLLGNINEELSVGRAVANLGAEKVKSLMWFHPKSPDLSLHGRIDSTTLSENILELYNAYRKPVSYQASDVVEAYRSSQTAMALLEQGHKKPDSLSLGSNNWVVRGELMTNGKPLMANDPHRTITVPSLRYMIHLSAPGWDVIGGGEPEIPGVSIGHNGYGAWGLTVFRTDGEDLYVYETNPENPNQYRYKGNWLDMEVIQEEIPVKGQENYTAQMKYSRHGPIVYEDLERNLAYAVRCAWLEPGGSPYLASLRMDQAKSWEEFREACNYSHIPGENMIWADADGNIGWQAVGIAPVRTNFSGMVPVPGDGRFEWEGYLPIVEKPNAFNPPSGFIATANENVTPESYTRWEAIGYTWADSFRGQRIDEILDGGEKLTMNAMKDLQTDYLSLPARRLVPYLENLGLEGREKEAMTYFEGWDFRLTANSVPAAIYVSWENAIKEKAHREFVPDEAKTFIQGLQLERILEWIDNPGEHFGTRAKRDEFLRQAFEEAVAFLADRLGPQMDGWQYGQYDLKHIELKHALSASVSDSLRSELDLPSLPRGGNGYTPGSTGNNYNQSSGATFRIIVPVGEWDKALGINSPGQSGNPDSPYYDNLYRMWGEDGYFPLYYSRDSILKYADSELMLKPR
ncbi:penicillin acylase family protein [Robiginitalea aurantiaca]|uniref:Penicillin acylase family protein n=1 Tax=Robiginitalea aurantiaca TaxID=3056915 RepID=A0ABT7WB26_9FLAO|nr:penicillin acylase family protein [Robiginitalea aurantiaca]MDM9630117.1 penicillin acylase family protein [Robiginitalea aurantiaca]